MTDTPPVIVPPDAPPVVIHNTIVTKIDSEYELLSGEVRRGLADGVKVGGAVLVLVGVATAVVPEMHLPAADLTVITAIGAGVTAFISWATRHGITGTKQ